MGERWHELASGKPLTFPTVLVVRMGARGGINPYDVSAGCWGWARASTRFVEDSRPCRLIPAQRCRAQALQVVQNWGALGIVEGPTV